MSELVDRAEAAMRQGRFVEARDVLRTALEGALSPALTTEAQSMLGLALVGTGDHQNALPYLRAAAAAEPNEAIFRYNLGRGLSAAGDYHSAAAEHGAAVRLAPEVTALQIAWAEALLAAGQAGTARNILERHASASSAPHALIRLLVQARAADGDTLAALDAARRLVPEDMTKAGALARADAMTAAGLAHSAMLYDEAIAILKQLTRSDPGDAEAATVLAQLLTWTEGPGAASAVLRAARSSGAHTPRLLTELLALGEDVAGDALTFAERSETPVTDRVDLLLALAQHHDRRGEAELAWSSASRGKAMLPTLPSRDWRGTLARQLEIYRCSPPTGLTGEPPRQLYLLGTPRSGQSLVQSILAAAPGVASLGERGALLQHLLFRDEELAATPDKARSALFEELAAADRRGMARLFGSPALVVDKSPLHLPVAGNVARVHPSARFAAVLRDPADVAISIWLRRFPPIYDYANDFGSILGQLDFALDAIGAWRDAGLAIHVIDFERFVGDPGPEARQLFDWLGIEWNDSYLDPSQRKAPVPTYSALQVRMPVGQGGSRGAAPYAGMLEPWQQQIESLRAKQERLLSESR